MTQNSILIHSNLQGWNRISFNGFKSKVACH